MDPRAGSCQTLHSLICHPQTAGPYHLFNTFFLSFSFCVRESYSGVQFPMCCDLQTQVIICIGCHRTRTKRDGGNCFPLLKKECYQNSVKLIKNVMELWNFSYSKQSENPCVKVASELLKLWK